MQDSILRHKSYAFAVRIIRLTQNLQETKKEFILSRQVLKSGTAIGALIREGIYAQSRADLINKLSIALKEAGETDYWLNLLKDTNYIEERIFLSFTKDCIELIKILTATIRTLKGLNS
jgi:four helix bundle protein